MIQMKPADTAVLTTMRSSVWSAWVQERASRKKHGVMHERQRREVG